MKTKKFDLIDNLALKNLNDKIKIEPDLHRIGRIKNGYIFYSSLLNRVFLSDNKLGDVKNKDILHVFPVPDNQSFGPRTLMFIFPTTNCNLRCKYCYARGGEKKIDVDLELAKKSIDFFLKLKKNPESLCVRFQGGGEPTVKIGLVKKIVTYARKKVKKAYFGIQTNGVFSEKTALWLGQNMNWVSISCDGPPLIQNKQRPFKNGEKTSHFVERTIRILSKSNINLFVRSTVTAYSVKKQREILEYFYRLGIKQIHFSPLFKMGRSGQTTNLFTQRPDFNTYINEFLAAKELAEELNIYLKENIFFSLYCKKDIFCDCSIPNFMLTTDGFISACYDDYLGKSHEKSPFIYGKYDKKNNKFILNEKKIKYLQRRTVNNIKKCHDCFLKWNCGGGCPSRALRVTKDIFKPSKEDCLSARKVSKKYIVYRAEKYWEGIKPFFERKKAGLFFIMYFNKFKLIETGKNSIKGSSLIKINPAKKDLNLLLEQILFCKNKEYEPKLFLLSFNFSKNDLNVKVEKKIEMFLSNLKKNKVFFKITKPFPKRLFGLRHEEVIKNYKIPKDCYECLELFTVQNKRIRFCNGIWKNKKISDYLNRKEIFEDYEKTRRKYVKRKNKESGHYCGVQV